MTATYLVENSHDAAECDPALEAVKQAASDASARVRDDTLLCTCPHGVHGGSLVIEAENDADAESFARRWDVGQTTVKRLSEIEVG